MKLKRSYKFILIFIVCVQLFTFKSYAHKGRTDANGGHYDRSTGEYHYHHGYGPHQHIDGVCPYDYDIKDSSQSSVDLKYDDTETNTKYQETISTVENDKNQNDKLILKNICGIFIGFWWLIIPLLYCFFNYIKDKFINKNEKNQDIHNINIENQTNDNQTIIKNHNDYKYKCPRCGGKLVIKHGKYGSFIGCSNYPRCKYTRKINKKY